MSKQSRIGSLVESLINVVIGYGIAILSQVFIFPWYGIHVSIKVNLAMGGWFTVVSIARSYCIRRWFNDRIHRFAERVTE